MIFNKGTFAKSLKSRTVLLYIFKIVSFKILEIHQKRFKRDITGLFFLWIFWSFELTEIL